MSNTRARIDALRAKLETTRTAAELRTELLATADVDTRKTLLEDLNFLAKEKAAALNKIEELKSQLQ
jgi:hypothetical protein